MFEFQHASQFVEYWFRTSHWVPIARCPRRHLRMNLPPNPRRVSGVAPKSAPTAPSRARVAPRHLTRSLGSTTLGCAKLQNGPGYGCEYTTRKEGDAGRSVCEALASSGALLVLPQKKTPRVPQSISKSKAKYTSPAPTLQKEKNTSARPAAHGVGLTHQVQDASQWQMSDWEREFAALAEPSFSEPAFWAPYEPTMSSLYETAPYIPNYLGAGDLNGSVAAETSAQMVLYPDMPMFSGSDPTMLDELLSLNSSLLGGNLGGGDNIQNQLPALCAPPSPSESGSPAHAAPTIPRKRCRDQVDESNIISFIRVRTRSAKLQQSKVDPAPKKRPKHSTMQRILSFPPEITALLFHIVLVSTFYNYPARWAGVRHILEMVCKDWHTFVGSMPTLWSHFYVTKRTTLAECDAVLIFSAIPDMENSQIVELAVQIINTRDQPSLAKFGSSPESSCFDAFWVIQTTANMWFTVDGLRFQRPARGETTQTSRGVSLSGHQAHIEVEFERDGVGQPHQIKARKVPTKALDKAAEEAEERDESEEEDA
ncbi:hypothetical protein K438DRAFT_1781222 [Mycena galopus ATCC 62051]|nr:hypothetical protein K438DRAFT_1781222 [Mycena galopus ATCC 62051]